MQIVDNKALLLNVRNPALITAVIPDSKIVDANRVLVRWRLEEAQVLKNIGVKKVPSPILRDYKWPGIHRPFKHQRETASFLTLHKRAFCFSEPGTGKTSAAIWAADYLMNVGVVNRVLVVCPLSIMDSAWRSDVFSTAMHRTVDIAYGSADKRRAILRSDAEIVIINYDGVEIVEKEIAAGGFNLIIVDEASGYQSATTRRWKTLHRLITPDTWLWMMTGTPAAQGPEKAYGLIKLVNPSKCPKFFGTFRDMVLTKITQFKYIPKVNSAQIVHELMQPAIRFTKAECLDLPPMTYVRRDVEMSKQQKKYYDILKKSMMIEASGERVTAVNAAVQLNKSLQISCGCAYADGGNVLEFDIKPKYKVLREVLDETPNKVLVFVPFKNAITLLVDQLNADGYSATRIDGEVSAQKRTEIFRDFQSTDNIKVLVIQPQAAAHGVTLTAADTVVWWGPVPSLEIYDQANARIDRQGQKNPTTVIQLCASGVERHIYTLLDKRIDVHSALIEKYKEIVA